MKQTKWSPYFPLITGHTTFAYEDGRVKTFLHSQDGDIIDGEYEEIDALTEWSYDPLDASITFRNRQKSSTEQ